MEAIKPTENEYKLIELTGFMLDILKKNNVPLTADESHYIETTFDELKANSIN